MTPFDIIPLGWFTAHNHKGNIPLRTVLHINKGQTDTMFSSLEDMVLLTQAAVRSMILSSSNDY